MKIMNAMDNKDRLAEQRQQRIQADIDKELKLQKKRDLDNKERRKERLELSTKKETAMQNARASVSQRVKEINQSAVGAWRTHVDEMKEKQKKQDMQLRERSEKMRNKFIEKNR